MRTCRSFYQWKFLFTVFSLLSGTLQRQQHQLMEQNAGNEKSRVFVIFGPWTEVKRLFRPHLFQRKTTWTNSAHGTAAGLLCPVHLNGSHWTPPRQLPHSVLLIAFSFEWRQWQLPGQGGLQRLGSGKPVLCSLLLWGYGVCTQSLSETSDGAGWVDSAWFCQDGCLTR